MSSEGVAYFPGSGQAVGLFIRSPSVRVGGRHDGTELQEVELDVEAREDLAQLVRVDRRAAVLVELATTGRHMNRQSVWSRSTGATLVSSHSSFIGLALPTRREPADVPE